MKIRKMKKKKNRKCLKLEVNFDNLPEIFSFFFQNDRVFPSNLVFPLSRTHCVYANIKEANKISKFLILRKVYAQLKKM